MDRRKSIKALLVGGAAVGTLMAACENPKKTDKKTAGADTGDKPTVYGRTAAEADRDAKLKGEKFFTDAEMATITVLADIIIPKDEHSGSASDAKVPAFIEFMAKDQPSHQIPLRGGLRWLDVQMASRFGKSFVECTQEQQIAMVELIAWPEKAAPELSQGVSFFNHLRDLTATGFYTTRIGINDLGYMGNTPNEWDGPPADVLAQYGLAYDEKYLPLYLKMEDRGKIMTWED
ncbi:Gluconate 2-dehydrogenase subunit 3 [Chitinophaga costaii]|uniref:Gluconate 2-dehydrogenase subunit 3 n=1 Tax=Chitinophaga costaii TaxID=1335309 RepID=A0A1C4AD74_9BACT|nr:gluconate 2-dehydrogenase subunit 3 family protein [Chitinophaga costaii]PUZ26561.1 gluconate 2-dehydrogenase subunit 3 family protein [Chitinophaga costaii]SCB92543.1 Gluconate 2-dehydrogenase subunit 3 [Chitinophaga costaii]